MALDEGEGLVVRRLATGKWGVYCSKKYAAESGKPQNGEDLVSHPIIAGAGDLARFDPAFLKEAKAKGAKRAVPLPVSRLSPSGGQRRRRVGGVYGEERE